MILAVTGHRPDKLGGYGPSETQTDVRNAIRNALHIYKPSLVITGMALGVDQWMAETCIEVGIPFLAAVPFPGQEFRWPTESQDRYWELLKKAARVHICSPGPYSAKRLQDRNEWMVDHSQMLLAVWDGSPGGTANCISYARRVGRSIVFVSVDNGAVSCREVLEEP